MAKPKSAPTNRNLNVGSVAGLADVSTGNFMGPTIERRIAF